MQPRATLHLLTLLTRIVDIMLTSSACSPGLQNPPWTAAAEQGGEQSPPDLIMAAAERPDPGEPRIEDRAVALQRSRGVRVMRGVRSPSCRCEVAHARISEPSKMITSPPGQT
jgi:hypothetical protein